MKDDTINREGYDRLWLWFGLSRASWCTLPRVMMHEMPDEWQGKMASDWKAASERHNDGNINKSIEINGERFEMSPQLIRIFENTAK